MINNTMCTFILLLMINAFQQNVDAGSKKVIIHVPYHVKNIKHTHTIYKIIKHEGNHHSDQGDRKKMSINEDLNKKVFFVMMMLLSNTFGGHDHEKSTSTFISIHFKIHLPEFIKHHIHTKTVFIHVHDMKPEEKENHKTDNHFEDWTSYSYNYNNGFKDSHLKSYHRKNLAIPYLNSIPIREHDYQIPNTPYYSSSNFPDTNNLQISNETSISIFKPFIGSTHIVDNQPSTDDNIRDISSQYKIYEDVDEEIPKNNNNNQQFYKQGYRYGIKTEMGHVIRKNMKDFIDNENEQESYRNDLYEDENSKSYNTLNNHGKYDKEIEQENKEATERIDKRLLVAKLVI